MAVITASCIFNSCNCESPGPGDSLPVGGPVQTTQCLDNLPSDTLPEYAQKCFAAIGVDVPPFNCDDGTLVPETNLTGIYPKQLCDAPNVLNGVCDPNSRFQVLKQTDEAVIVAHCRKQDNDDGFYGDIAVIQYNRINGATCFYQALENTLPNGEAPDLDDPPLLLTAQTTAPSEGNDLAQGKFPWLNPNVTAGIRCHRCHDNGPFVRSPYLAQLRNEPTNRLPGTNEGPGHWDQRLTWNKTLPYKFVGNDFQSWKVYSVSLSGTGIGCIQCHRMGISSYHGKFSTFNGTALDLGLIATAQEQLHKNKPHSEAAPIWMKPGQTIYDATAETQAIAAAACAAALVKLGNYVEGEPSPPPPPPECLAVEYGQGDTCTKVGR